MNLLQLLLLPLCLLYGLITKIRNKLFDWGVLSSRSYPLPVISLGNLSTGGTGKTPHAELLIRMLQPRYSIALVSRGYKRKTRGLEVATSESTAAQIGDEPLQIYKKFPGILVVVHEQRVQAMDYIQQHHPHINLVILDDAFQHRFVKPGLNLLLTEYYKPFFQNHILPCGTLREARSGASRAHSLIVTKTPKVFSPLDRRFFLKKLNPFPQDKIFFSYIQYGNWLPLDEASTPPPESQYRTLFLFTGIANTAALQEHLKTFCHELLTIAHADHHQFSENDLHELKMKYRQTYGGSKAIVITEKDAMRLQDENLRKMIRCLPVYYIPIEVDFHDSDREAFLEMVERFLSRFPTK